MKNKQPIRTMEISRGRANEQTSNLTKVRENAGYKVAIGYHWNLIGLKSGASFFGPIIEQSEASPDQFRITVDV